MNDQIQLPFAAGPNVTAEEVERLCQHLADRGWVRATQLESELGIDDRHLRALCEHAHGRILTGQRGHRLNDRTVTAEEVDRSAAWKIAQGKKMIRRGLAERRHHHLLLSPA